MVNKTELAVNIGDRLAIKALGLTSTGTVVSAEFITNYGEINDGGWDIEMKDSNVSGGYCHWQQRNDGGFIFAINGVEYDEEEQIAVPELEFSKTRVVATVAIPMNITEEDIMYIITGAFEGGCSWMGLKRGDQFKAKPKSEPVSTWATKILLEGGALNLYDNEDPDEKFALTLPKLLAGIEMNAEKRPEHADFDDMDADDYDCIMQYALFGELVYA